MSKLAQPTHTDSHFVTQDGRLLAATYYQPSHSNGRSVLINGATAVPRRYYQHYAHYLATQGFTVLTYDYRGIGDSRQNPIQRESATFRDWGEQDTAAAIAYLRMRTPTQPLLVVGHSAGGQVLGFAHNNQAITATLMISCQSGYWRLWPRRNSWLMASLWYVGIPLLTSVVGYVPARRLGLGSADLPGGIARQWAKWCRHRDYFVDDSGQACRPYFHTLTGPLLAYVIPDDWMAPRAAVDALMSYYPNADTEIRTLQPGDTPSASIGHFGYFKTSHQALWPEAAAWLSAQA
ncbi:MAG: alpha/beta fold hydrolase [Neisseriaceae bacterium]|nr:alpha/beta fold hydrolase [Neisseriaceae bacterium]